MGAPWCEWSRPVRETCPGSSGAAYVHWRVPEEVESQYNDILIRFKNENNISTKEEIGTSSTKTTNTESSACTQYILSIILVQGSRFDTRYKIGLGDMAISESSLEYVFENQYIYIMIWQMYA